MRMARYLQFRSLKTGEVDRRIDATGKSDRQVERIERGMLVNIHPDWCVDDVEFPSPEGSPQ